MALEATVKSATRFPRTLSSALRSSPMEPRGVLKRVAYEYTRYFENEVLRKRPYLKKDWCEFVIDNAEHSQPQEHNRIRFWAKVPELDGRYLRVITLADGRTIHNAFPDRGFKP